MKVALTCMVAFVPKFLSSQHFLKRSSSNPKPLQCMRVVWLTNPVSSAGLHVVDPFLCSILPHFDLVLTRRGGKKFVLISREASCHSWERLTWDTLTFISWLPGGMIMCSHVFIHGFVCAYMFEKVRLLCACRHIHTDFPKFQSCCYFILLFLCISK